ncbi:cadherin domain-containing protein [Candidatus Poribacteria bacterium]|nr:cadherin domain-containing protein [Candidatus Poribacteria bacterium]
MSATSTGTFTTSLSLSTDVSGEVSFFIKADTNSFFDTAVVTGSISVGTNTISASFTGTITDVLNFSAATATRSVVEGTAANMDIGAAVSATHWANADADTTNNVTLEYSLEGTDAASFSIDTTGQLKTSAALDHGTKNSYSVTVKVEEKGSGITARSSDTIAVTITVTRLPAPTGLTATPGDGQVRLSWTAPSTTAAITGYEYSSDDGNNWAPSGTGITVLVGNLTNGTAYTFKVRAVSGSIKGIASTSQTATPAGGVSSPQLPSDGTTSPVDTTPVVEADPETPQRRRLIYECPVGWVRSDGFAGRTRRVLLYEVKLEMDLHNPVSIYKPDWVAIYVHPDEALQDLDGWKLQVALPYNHHSEYPLTAENSVIVDSKIEGVDGGFAFIENPEEDPFPMVGIGFTGSPAPGFDYRLYDETGRRVDFGISCYKRFDIFQVLKEMEDPRVLRNVLLETLDWDTHYLRSEWTVPVPVAAAPSQIKGNIVGTWGALKKQ